MKIAEEIPKTTTWSNLGNRALYLIATLPEKQKQEEISNSPTCANIVSKDFARKFMMISSKLSNRSTSNDLGYEALYIIATLPKEQKQKEISNDLTLSHLDIDKDFTNKFMKVAEEIPKRTTLSNISNTALYLIATLSEERTDERRVRR
ncbi:hypothetical protein P7H55_09455 [Vagococcus lutrae]|uniref:hypothetical protein n=1 Tax=Vagococcus lutrae TaxID=81947 RepID=UPI00288E18EF|nr:hypothetical protein [Vagococcus lutrae]MDT2818065.1 hypothetical protein [Vagococcus lutrae]